VTIKQHTDSEKRAVASTHRTNWVSRPLKHEWEWGGRVPTGTVNKRRLANGEAPTGIRRDPAAPPELRERLLAKDDGGGWSNALATLDRFDGVIRDIHTKYAGRKRAADYAALLATDRIIIRTPQAPPQSSGIGGGGGGAVAPRGAPTTREAQSSAVRARALQRLGARIVADAGRKPAAWLAGGVRAAGAAPTHDDVAAAVAALEEAASLAASAVSVLGAAHDGEGDSDAPLRRLHPDTLFQEPSVVTAGGDSGVDAGASIASLTQLLQRHGAPLHAPGVGPAGARNAPSALAVSLRASLADVLAPPDTVLDASSAVAHPTRVQLLRARTPASEPRVRGRAGAARDSGGAPPVSALDSRRYPPVPADASLPSTALSSAYRRHRRVVAPREAEAGAQERRGGPRRY
jgi:hypothetical protein